MTIFGKLFCCAFAIVGIPLCFNVVGLVRKSIIEFATKVDKIIRKLYGKIGRMAKNDGEDEKNRRKQQQQLAISTIVLMMALYYTFIFSTTAVISVAEGWNYLTSLYYAFITLTTIGIISLFLFYLIKFKFKIPKIYLINRIWRPHRWTKLGRIA